MPTDRIDIERDRLAWLRQNLLVRVERSAADGVRISTWLMTGTAAVFVLALQEEIKSTGVTIGVPILWLLFSAVVAAGVGAAFGFWVGHQAVRDFDAGANATEDLARALAAVDITQVDKAQKALSKSGHDDRIALLLGIAVSAHLASAVFLVLAGAIAVGMAAK